MNACKWCGGPLPEGSRANRQFCTSNCRKRQFAHEKYRGRCEVCGAETAVRSKVRCTEHYEAREAADTRRRTIVEMWANGAKMSEIATAVGWRMNPLRSEFGRMRDLGYDLPHRRTPEQRERIRAGQRRSRGAGITPTAHIEP